jgi:hypothetical protein
MKAKKLNFKNLLLNFAVMFILGGFLALPAIACAAGAVISGTIMSIVGQPGLMAGLQKEIWTDIILEKFYPDGSFLAEGRDMSMFVSFNTLNLAEAGADPDVLIDNTAYPIPTSTRTDIPHTIALKTLDTTSSIVRNLEEMESSYDKMTSVTRGHKMALLKKCAVLAAWNWSPLSDSAFTPVLKATGDINPLTGFRRLKIEDVTNMEAAFDDMDIPAAGRILVLTPKHMQDLKLEDLKLFKAAMIDNKLFSFSMRSTTVTPKFNVNTGVKVPFGAVDADTDGIASFAFFNEEVMKAMGSVEMFYKFKDPDQKGDVFNFQLRFIALPMRAKYVAALYSPKD